MKKGLLKNLMLVVAIVSFAPFAVADDAMAAKTIAGIVAELNHFPSDDQKATLMEIAGDDEVSDSIKAIAEAVHGIQHQPTDEAKTALQAIVADGSADATTKALAEVVMGLNHQASEEAKAALAAI